MKYRPSRILSLGVELVHIHLQLVTDSSPCPACPDLPLWPSDADLSLTLTMSMLSSLRHSQPEIRTSVGVQTEFKYLQRSIAAGTAAPQIHDLTMVGDRVTQWQFKLKGFNDDVPGRPAKNWLL